MNQKLRNNSKLWSRVFWGWIILVVLLTAMPVNPDLGISFDNFWMRPDYMEHLTFYFILGLLFYPYLYTRPETQRITDVRYWFLSGFVFAVITEFYQLYNPYRSFSYWDMMLNIGGLFTGVLAGYLLFRTWKNPAEIKEKINI
jgi:VanZ family protein